MDEEGTSLVEKMSQTSTDSASNVSSTACVQSTVLYCFFTVVSLLLAGHFCFVGDILLVGIQLMGGTLSTSPYVSICPNQLVFCEWQLQNTLSVC